MTLPESNSRRKLIHERKVSCYGYRRDDELWDIEGHLTDTKTYDFSNMDRGPVPAGEPVHEMWLRITVDDDLLVHATIASTDYAPFNICPGAVANFSKIKGIKIGPGFQKEVVRLVGGSLGCTHLRELLGPMATTAIQTIVPIRTKKDNGNVARISSLVGYLPRLCPGAARWYSASGPTISPTPSPNTGPTTVPLTGPAFLLRRQAG